MVLSSWQKHASFEPAKKVRLDKQLCLLRETKNLHLLAHIDPTWIHKCSRSSLIYIYVHFYEQIPTNLAFFFILQALFGLFFGGLSSR